MAGLRKGSAVRNLTRPYTRKSKFKKKNFIKIIPGTKVVKFDMGAIGKDFPYEVSLISKDSMNLRQNAIESARQLVNRRLLDAVGAMNYKLKIRIYPHHILRENKMLTGAHADRMQTGMSHSFGTPIGSAARVKKGQILFTAYVDKINLDKAKYSLWGATARIPAKCSLEIKENKK